MDFAPIAFRKTHIVKAYLEKKYHLICGKCNHLSMMDSFYKMLEELISLQHVDYFHLISLKWGMNFTMNINKL